jgi:polysaccharide deacetylase family protein (PEP-CTERM system associated)
VRATFFVLGWVAERHPFLIRDISAAGHEIATHGYWHKLIYCQTPSDFADDVQRSIIAIRSALGGNGPATWDLRLGYRAPAFSITQRSLWALDILGRYGIRYDSSIFPLAVHDRYGLGDAYRFAHRVGNGIWEFPLSTVRLCGHNWPVAGGGYLRLFPFWYTRWCIHHINGEGQPAVIYVHPWELDWEQPRVTNAPLLSRFRHYVNLRETEQRLVSLLREFRFGPIREVFAHHLKAT